MICPYCEQEVNTQFCPHCGARQELPKQPPQEQITPEVPQTPVNVNVTFAVPESFTHVCPRCGRREGEPIDPERVEELKRLYPEMPAFHGIE